MRFLTLIFLLFCSCVHAKEFLYPTAVDMQRSVVYLIYQKSIDHLELWEWNYATGNASPMLLSRFTPAGFRMLPSGSGFSFIDRGGLKVKQFIKRSPRNIEFDAPIFNVELVHWLDDRSCYTCGKYNEHYGIFHIDYDGQVSPLCMSEVADCLYPQKVGNDLFYIERDVQWNYRIMKRDYTGPVAFRTFPERKTWYDACNVSTDEILDSNGNTKIFLSMTSEKEGFFLEHPKLVSKRERFISFSYHHLKKEGDQWASEVLFKFSIPSEFLLLGSEQRLYEALLPILPRHFGDRIFYVDAVGEDLGIFCYDMGLKLSRGVVHEKNRSFFSPLLIDQELFLGGAMGHEVKIEWEDAGVVAGLRRVSCGSLQ